jgi:tetratricopeptide (TPR) repeat protein
MQSSARRGDVQFAAGDPAGALGYYQQALSACPSNAQVQFYVARAYEARGDRDMAIDYYERAIRFASSDDQAIAEAARKALARLSVR